MKSCHRCAQPWPDDMQPGYNNTCDGCGTPVHACANCEHHHPQGRNRCAVPGLPVTANPAEANRCESFRYRVRSVAGEAEADAAIADLKRDFLADGGAAPAKGRLKWDQLFDE